MITILISIGNPFVIITIIASTIDAILVAFARDPHHVYQPVLRLNRSAQEPVPFPECLVTCAPAGLRNPTLIYHHEATRPRTRVATVAAMLAMTAKVKTMSRAKGQRDPWGLRCGSSDGPLWLRTGAGDDSPTCGQLCAQTN